MRRLSCYPSYLKSSGRPLKVSLTGNGERVPLFLKRGKRKIWETHRLVSLTMFVSSKITEPILLETMLRHTEIKEFGERQVGLY